MFKKLFGDKSTGREKISQPGTNSAAEQWFELGNSMQKDNPEQAVVLYEKALPFFNDDTPQRFLICYNLCTSYINISRPDFVKAIKYAELAVPIARRLKATKHEYKIFEANVLHNWGIALFNSKDIVKGKKIFEQAIDARKKILPESQRLKVYLAHTLTSFSESLVEAKDFSEGVKFLEEAILNFRVSIQDAKVVDVPNYPATIPNRLAVVLRALEGRVSPEKKYFELAVSLQDIYIAYIKLITNKSPDYWEPLGAAQTLLGHILGLFDLNRAIKSHQSSLTIFTYLKDYYKLDHADKLAESSIMLGHLFMLQQEFEKALEKVNEGLVHIKRSKNPNAPMIKKLTDLAGSVQKLCGMILKK